MGDGDGDNGDNGDGIINNNLDRKLKKRVIRRDSSGRYHNISNGHDGIERSLNNVSEFSDTKCNDRKRMRREDSSISHEDNKDHAHRKRREGSGEDHRDSSKYDRHQRHRDSGLHRDAHDRRDRRKEGDECNNRQFYHHNSKDPKKEGFERHDKDRRKDHMGRSGSGKRDRHYHHDRDDREPGEYHERNDREDVDHDKSHKRKHKSDRHYRDRDRDDREPREYHEPNDREDVDHDKSHKRKRKSYRHHSDRDRDDREPREYYERNDREDVDRDKSHRRKHKSDRDYSDRDRDDREPREYHEPNDREDVDHDKSHKRKHKSDRHYSDHDRDGREPREYYERNDREDADVNKSHRRKHESNRHHYDRDRDNREPRNNGEDVGRKRRRRSHSKTRSSGERGERGWWRGIEKEHEHERREYRERDDKGEHAKSARFNGRKEHDRNDDHRENRRKYTRFSARLVEDRECFADELRRNDGHRERHKLDDNNAESRRYDDTRAKDSFAKDDADRSRSRESAINDSDKKDVKVRIDVERSRRHDANGDESEVAGTVDDIGDSVRSSVDSGGKLPSMVTLLDSADFQGDTKSLRPHMMSFCHPCVVRLPHNSNSSVTRELLSGGHFRVLDVEVVKDTCMVFAPSKEDVDRVLVMSQADDKAPNVVERDSPRVFSDCTIRIRKGGPHMAQLVERFQKHGKTDACEKQKNDVLIQYSKPSEALRAFRCEYGRTLGDITLTVEFSKFHLRKPTATVATAQHVARSESVPRPSMSNVSSRKNQIITKKVSGIEPPPAVTSRSTSAVGARRRGKSISRMGVRRTLSAARITTSTRVKSALPRKKGVRSTKTSAIKEKRVKVDDNHEDENSGSDSDSSAIDDAPNIVECTYQFSWVEFVHQLTQMVKRSANDDSNSA